MKTLMKQLGVLTVLLLSFLQAVAYDFYSDGIYYNILSESDRTVEVTKPDIDRGKYSGIIEIPKKVIERNKTYTVVQIGYRAFRDCTGLTTVTFPESLTTIDSSAFGSCTGLTNVTFPESLTTIGTFAFSGCTGLTNVSLPESLLEIGEGVFGDCSKLENIYIGTNNSQYTSSEGVLYSKNLTVLICCPAGKKYVNLPESLTTIGPDAFRGCTGLTNVTFPESLTTIGSYAFQGCTGLTNVTFPESLTTIDFAAFDSCTGLTTVTFPESLTTIDFAAFRGCTGLTNVTFPESLTTIGSWAFGWCTGLTNVTFPESLTMIGDDAFYRCTSLREINVKDPTPINCSPSFSDDNYKTTILYVPKGSMAEYEKVDPWRNFWNIEEKDFSSVDNIELENNTAIRCYVNGGMLVIEGLGADERIEVCVMTGRIVYSGLEHTIANLAPGIYIVKAADNTLKIRI